MSSIAETNSLNLDNPPPERKPIPLYFVVVDNGEIVNRFVIAITPLDIANLMMNVIPNWLKDSRAPIPMSSDIDPTDAKGKQQILEMGRIAMKGFVSSSGMLISMGQDLYGANFKMSPREDSLPIVSQWLAWFVAAQIAKAPLEIVVENGYIRSIRQVEQLPVSESDASTASDHSERTPEG